MTTQYAISRIILIHFTSDPVWQLESYFLAGLAGEISGVWEKVRFQMFPWCLVQTPRFFVEFGLNSGI